MGGDLVYTHENAETVFRMSLPRPPDIAARLRTSEAVPALTAGSLPRNRRVTPSNQAGRQRVHKARSDRYQKMVYARCGRSGLDLPRVSLGLWHNFDGDRLSDRARQDAVERLRPRNQSFRPRQQLRTAPGIGRAESREAARPRTRRYRDELVISTKAGYLMWDGPYGEWGSRKYLLASLDQSLRRLGLEYVDIFYSHRFDPSTPLEETMGALESAVNAGKALYVGISSYGPEKTRQAAALLRDVENPVHHPPTLVLDVQSMDRTTGSSMCSAEEGLGCIAFSPLAQGMLTDKYLNGIPKTSRAAQGTSFDPSLLTDDKIARVQALNEIARRRGQSLAQMAVAWVLRDPRVTSALIGASRWSQIAEALAALDNTCLRSERTGRDRPLRRRQRHQPLGVVKRSGLTLRA